MKRIDPSIRVPSPGDGRPCGSIPKARQGRRARARRGIDARGRPAHRPFRRAAPCCTSHRRQTAKIRCRATHSTHRDDGRFYLALHAQDIAPTLHTRIHLPFSPSERTSPALPMARASHGFRWADRGGTVWLHHARQATLRRSPCFTTCCAMSSASCASWTRQRTRPPPPSAKPRLPSRRRSGRGPANDAAKSGAPALRLRGEDAVPTRCLLATP
jgi:hypothetical protein